MAADQVNLICASTMQSPESRALFYDELASALALKNPDDSKIDQTFLIWLAEFITQFFTISYTGDEGADEDIMR